MSEGNEGDTIHVGRRRPAGPDGGPRERAEAPVRRQEDGGGGGGGSGGGFGGGGGSGAGGGLGGRGMPVRLGGCGGAVVVVLIIGYLLISMLSGGGGGTQPDNTALQPSLPQATAEPAQPALPHIKSFLSEQR